MKVATFTKQQEFDAIRGQSSVSLKTRLSDCSIRRTVVIVYAERVPTRWKDVGQLGTRASVSTEWRRKTRWFRCARKNAIRIFSWAYRLEILRWSPVAIKHGVSARISHEKTFLSLRSSESHDRRDR